LLKPALVFAILMALPTGTALLAGQTTEVFTSPDHALRAVVATDAAGESRVEIRALPERVLLGRDQRSPDGAHGYCVVHAAWTPDSAFFVASTESSGGHQPWARPLWVYSRAKNRIMELSRFGVVTTGDFTIAAPDIVKTVVIACDGGASHRDLVFSLHRFLSTERLPIAPCPGR
jgi:hypothetical protein